VWTSTTLPGDIRGYSTYNITTGVGINGGSRYVAPGQAIWIRSYLAGSTFEVKSGARVHTTGVELKTASQTEDDVLRFELRNSYTYDEGAVVFRSIGSHEVTLNDSEKRLSSDKKVSNVYVLKGEKKVAVSLLPEIHEVSSVSLGYVAGSEVVGVSALRFTNIQDFKPGVSVYLLDKETNTKVDLRNQSVYEFDAVAGTNDNRFEVVFESIVTDIDDVQVLQQTKEIQVYAYYKPGNLEVFENLLPENTSSKVLVTVSEINGRIIHQSDYTSSGQHTINTILKKGIYLITASSVKTGRYTCKIVVAE
jgi:hypothetical protein